MEFHDTQDLVKELLKNREVLTRQEEDFRAAIAPLADYRRRTVYEYVATMKERIRMLTEKCEGLSEDIANLYEKRENENGEKGIQTHSRDNRKDEKSGETSRKSATESGEF